MIRVIFFLIVLSIHVDSITLNRSVLFKNFGFTYESQVIDLSNKDIDKIDSGSFTDMKYLRSLYLQKNKISQIDEFTFSGLTSLKELWLESNYIISIDKNAFVKLDSLELLCLSGNPVSFPVYIKDICAMNPKCELKIFQKCDQTDENTITKRPATFDGKLKKRILIIINRNKSEFLSD